MCADVCISTITSIDFGKDISIISIVAITIYILCMKFSEKLYTLEKRERRFYWILIVSFVLLYIILNNIEFLEFKEINAINILFVVLLIVICISVI